MLFGWQTYIARYARWVYGQHPTDEMIQNYILEGAMFCCEKDGSILSAVAVTHQGEEYHGAAWSVSLEDDEVFVVHLLCVAPQWQGKGIARMTMQQIMAMSREMGKRVVRLDALTCNTPAHRLYESLGFQKRDQRRWYADNVGWIDFFLWEPLKTRPFCLFLLKSVISKAFRAQMQHIRAIISLSWGF